MKTWTRFATLGLAAVALGLGAWLMTKPSSEARTLAPPPPLPRAEAQGAEPVSSLETTPNSRTDAADVAPVATAVPPALVKQDFETKYAGSDVPGLLAARARVEKELSMASSKILKEMIRTGACEVSTHKLGEPISYPNLPPWWATAHQSKQIDPETELTQTAILDPHTIPETAALIDEAQWIAARVDSLGGDRHEYAEKK